MGRRGRPPKNPKPPDNLDIPKPKEPLLSVGDGVLRNNYGNRWWRIQNLYSIRDKMGRLINMKFNSIQRRIIRGIVPVLKEKIFVNGLWHPKPIRSFDLKYRQGGVSTFWLIFWLDDTIFRSNVITGILADKHENLKKLMEIVRLGWETMPTRIRPEVLDDSKEKLSFKHNRSQLFASLSIRSTNLTNLHISEWCFCKDREILSSFGATSPLTNISGESTGNGIGNDGYDKYQDAKKSLNEFTARFSPWFIQKEYTLPVPEGQEENILESINPEERVLQDLMKKDYRLMLTPGQVLWRRQTKRTLRELFPQEYPETDRDAFLTSGTMFFDGKKIEALYREAREWHETTKPFRQDTDGWLWTQFFDVKKDHVYAAGADTADEGKDYSVLKIIDVTDRTEAFVYRGRVGIKAFYYACNEWCRYYNNALLAVERNNHGHAVLLGLEDDKEYPSLYDQVLYSPNTRLRIDQFPKKKVGWDTTKQSRALMLDQIRMAIEGEPEEDEHNFRPTYTVLDKDFLKEALTFRLDGGKYQAISGMTDDDIIASAIAFQMFLIQLRHRIETAHSGYYASGAREATSAI